MKNINDIKENNSEKGKQFNMKHIEEESNQIKKSSKVTDINMNEDDSIIINMNGITE